MKINLMFLLITFLYLNLEAKQILNRVVVVVNSDPILQSDFDKLQKRITQRGSIDESLLLGEKIENLKSDKKLQLDFLIHEKLIEKEIKKQNFSASSERVEQELNQMAKRGQMSRSDFNKYIVSQGMDLEGYRANLKSRIERQEFFSSEIISKLSITDEDAYGEYQTKKSSLPTKC